MNIKKILWLIASLGCLAAVLGSCTRTADPDGCGYVTLRLSTDTAVEQAATKASGDDVVAVKIYNGESSELAWSCEDASTVTEPLTFGTGPYTAEAVCGAESAAAWDSPFYYCAEDFTVYTNKNTELNLVLTLANMKVTVAFSEDFDTYFTSYDLSVTNGSGTLDFDKNTEGREGYFSATGSLVSTLSLTNTNGQKYTYTYSYSDVVARQYYAFSFSLDPSTGSGSEGAGEITVILDDTMNEKQYNFDIDLTETHVYASNANAWARFATLTGEWSGTQPDGLGFQWRKAGEENWTTVDGDITINATDWGTSFSAELKGLTPDTEYEFRAISDEETDTEALSFTTEAEQVVPNMNFDSWYDAYTPNADENETVWDTANGGTSLLSVYPTTREDEHLAVEGDGKHAVRMESKYVILKFAAGNIYTGKFGSANIASMSASLNWGYEFTSRPLALKGWYDYTPVAIDRANDPYTDMKGQMDVGQIQIFFTDWDSQFTIDSGTSTYVDFDADYIIARGVMLLNQTDGYTEFTLNLDYRDTERTPTYIVITCSSSAYGDYFTGGTGSLLYVDEFSLVYDPDELD